MERAHTVLEGRYVQGTIAASQKPFDLLVATALAARRRVVTQCGPK
jgi:hypothetical protein